MAFLLAFVAGFVLVRVADKSAVADGGAGRSETVPERTRDKSCKIDENGLVT